MEPYSHADNNVSTPKMMALFGALCMLYFLFSPLPGSRDSSEYVIYMVKGGGEQWVFLGFTILTTVLVFCRFWYCAVISALGLVGTQIVLVSGVLLKHFLIFTIIRSAQNGTQFHFSIFGYVLGFLVKVLFPPPPTALWVSPFYFQSLSALQMVLLVAGTILLFIAPFQHIRLMRKPEKLESLLT